MVADQLLAALLRAAGAVTSLEAFLYSDEAAALLADPLLAAAREALTKARLSTEPRQQVWSAVNHLEAAHQTMKAIHERAWSAQFFVSRQMFLNRLAHKDKFALCMMACCYKVLGQEQLCRDALASAAAVNASRFLFGRTNAGLFELINLVDLRLYRELICWVMTGDGHTDVDAFQRALAGDDQSSTQT